MTLRRRTLLKGAAALAALAATGCARPAGTASSGGAPRRRTPTLASRAVAAIVPGLHTVDGAGVSLIRQLGQPLLRHLDPWVLLDQLHSDDPSAYIRGFPDHPHRGFETVSVMLEGRIRHHDSRGHGGLITGGGAQWMTAGRGIVHSEMPEQENGMLWGFQLWINLPRAEKWRAQEYQDLAPGRIAEVALDRGGALRVISGEQHGACGPVAPRTTAPLLLTLHMPPREDVELRVERDAAVMTLVADGDVELGENGDVVREDELAVLEPRGQRVRVRAGERGARVLFAAAQPIGEPIVQSGPFVMSNDEEIRQAWADYRAGTLG